MSIENIIDKSDVLLWKEQKITKKLYTEMSKLREDYMNAMLNGSTMKNANQEVKDTAYALGIIKGLNLVFELELYDKVKKEDE